MKKRYIILIIAISLLLLVGGYLGYKIYYANYYDLSHIDQFENYRDNFVINDKTFTITTTNLSEEEYLIFKNIKLKNIFDGFESRFNSDEFEFPHDGYDSIWYVLKDKETDEQIAAIGLGKGPTMFEEYKSESYIFGDERVGKTKNMAKVFENYNITNDIELLKFAEKTKNHKNGIFDSVEEMKNLYSIHLLNVIRYANNKGITLIDGDYEGYIIDHNFEGPNVVEYNILKNSKRYCITFIGLEYFTDEKIQDLLNTLVIE